MANDEGRRLTDAELQEYRDYHNAQLPLPDKYANVVADGTDVRGQIFRFATAEEVKAAKDEASAALKDQEEHAQRSQKMRDAALKANADAVNRVSVPERPAGDGSKVVQP